MAFDSTNDLALIRLSETADNLRPPVIPALRSRVRLGEPAFVFGYPLSGLLSSAGNFTSGSISSLSGLGDDISKLQISAPVQPGNSGGPLLDLYGNVVGVVVAKLNAGQLSQLINDIPQNVNFAIKASVAISFLEANNAASHLFPKTARHFSRQMWRRGRDNSRSRWPVGAKTFDRTEVRTFGGPDWSEPRDLPVQSEIELVRMTFAFPPARPGGAPVFNFRSEGRQFAKSNRCLIPASAFFEFTGKKYPKAKHRFALRGSPITAIAGLWREAQGNHPPTFTMLTTTPGPDIAPFHNRQVVVLQPENWSAWLHLTKPEAELLRPLSEGSLDVETVREGSG
jgi:SOS response associated peptidase (SRAP)/Trypsin-like peptidase domain